MNIDNINKVIQAIRVSETFDMGRFWMPRSWLPSETPECGTPSCIAGHAAFLAGHREISRTELTAKEFLGLEVREMNRLFYATYRDERYDLDKITAEQAIRTLEILRDTGEVRWDLTAPELKL